MEPYKYKHIELSQFRSFCLAATKGNFTAAAQALGLSTSAVWQQVRALERRLGATLLRRRGRFVALTNEGQLLLELALPHVSGLDSLGRLFESRRAELPQQLIVAATPFLLSYHMPNLVQEFKRAHPTVQLCLRAGRWHEVLGLVERGEADVGIAPFDPEEPRRPSLDYEHLFDEPCVLLTCTHHPLARKKRVELRDLVQYPLIVEPEDTCDYRLLVRSLQRCNISTKQLRLEMVSHTQEMTFKYVAMGIGIALVHLIPRVVGSVPGLHMRVFDPPLESLPFALVIRKGSHLPDLAEVFCQAVRRLLRTNGPADG